VLGDLEAVDATAHTLTIRKPDGSSEAVSVTDTTEYLRVQPGETSLQKAERITPAALEVGDRVWARGAVTGGKFVTRQVVLMSAKAIADRQDRQRRDWRMRGTFGEVVSVDTARGEFTVKDRRGATVVVAVSTATELEKQKPGSTDFASAEPITLADLAVGSQVAVRGDLTGDDSRLVAESVVTGDFPRPAGGRVTAIDVAKAEVRVETMDGKPMTIVLTSGATVRKATPPAPPEGEKNGPPRPPAGGAPGGPPFGPGGPPPGGRPGGFGFGDRAELEKRTTAITLAELKTGDLVFAVLEPGSSGDTVRAQVLIKIELPAGAKLPGPPHDGGPMPGPPPQF
jgi:hypothetical protein